MIVEDRQIRCEANRPSVFFLDRNALYILQYYYTINKNFFAASSVAFSQFTIIINRNFSYSVLWPFIL